MIVYRIVKSEKRARDISGMGAFMNGGRWNSPGTYMLYASENSSLAFLETLVHFEADNVPPNLYIIRMEIDADEKLIYTLPPKSYPKNWLHIDYIENKLIGDKLMNEGKYLAVRVRSAINVYEYNYLLNPIFPRYHDLVKIISVERLDIDQRLIEYK